MRPVESSTTQMPRCVAATTRVCVPATGTTVPTICRVSQCAVVLSALVVKILPLMMSSQRRRPSLQTAPSPSFVRPFTPGTTAGTSTFAVGAALPDAADEPRGIVSREGADDRCLVCRPRHVDGRGGVGDLAAPIDPGWAPAMLG